MTKIVLNDVTNLSNQTSSQNIINDNNDTVVAGFDNTLSRDGTSPNAMEATLDMNSHRIINLPEATTADQPIRLGDITNYIFDFVFTKVPTISDPGKLLRVRDDHLGYDFGNVITDSGSANTYPVSNDGGSLGTTSNKWSDLFLASGSVVNFNSGDVLLTHSTDLLSFTGAANGYRFDASIAPTADDGAALGGTSLKWSDLFLANGGVINFNSGDVTITHGTDLLTFAGAANGYSFGTKLFPTTSDGAALGDTTHMFSDLFLASGGVVNFNNGDVTLTHSADNMAFAGGIYQFDNKVYPTTNDGAPLGDTTHNWSDLFLATGGVINFNNGNATITHSAGLLTVNVPITLNTINVTSSVIPANGVYLPTTNTLGFAVNSAAEIQLTSTALSPAVSDGNALGTSALMWGDLFLASGAVVNFNASDVTITHATDSLSFAGGSYNFDNDITLNNGATDGAGIVFASLANIAWGIDNNAGVLRHYSGGVVYNTLTTSALSPGVNDNNALGTTSLKWSDLFLASGAVIDFNSGDVTITHSTDALTFNGAANGYSFTNAITVNNTTPRLTLNTGSNFTNIVADATTGGVSINADAGNTSASSYISFAVDNAPQVGIQPAIMYPASNDLVSLGNGSFSWSDLFLASGAVVNFANGDYTLTHATGILTCNKDLRVTTVGTNTASVVTVGGTQTLTAKTLTSPVIATIVNTGTLTLPTSTDTLVGRATTDTLTNKLLTNCTATTQSPANNSTFVATTAYVDNATSGGGGGSATTGMIAFWSTNTVPLGWLECDGAAVSRTTYSSLFALIGTGFGVGDGSTTFNVPDNRGYFLRGWANAGSIDPSRVFGSSQAHAFQGHIHTATASSSSPDTITASFTIAGATGSTSGAIAQGGVGTGGGTKNCTMGGGVTTTTSVTVTGNGSTGSQGTVTTATETRPINKAYMTMIKW